MIRVRLFTKEEWFDLGILNKEHEYDVRDALGYFKWHLLDTAHEDEVKIPFRDAESLQFLRDTYGIRFISDDDWYSVWCEESRSDITCLYDTIQYGLAAIDMSKKGIYAVFKGAEERIWRCLASLPMDIKIAMPISEMGLHHEGIRGADYVIENYKYNGNTVEVFVQEKLVRHDEFYIPVPDHREYNTNYGLHVGKDGRYYSDWISMEYAYQYYWKNDLEGIIEQIKRMHKNRTIIGEITRVFNVFQLSELLEQNRYSIVDVCYANCSENLSQDEMEERCCSGCYKEKKPQECMEEYSYFRDTFKVISHLAVVPTTNFRKLPLMMIDKKKDGTYYVHGRLTYKFPSFAEILSLLMEERIVDKERYVLIIDTEELLESSYDIDRALCGFKVSENSIEVFDAYEGTQLWGQIAEEAYNSGKCTIDTDFY